MFANGSVKTGEWVVPAGHYFFMGEQPQQQQGQPLARRTGCAGVRSGAESSR